MAYPELAHISFDLAERDSSQTTQFRCKMEQAAAHLLDFSQPFDVTLLDQIVAIANEGTHPNRAGADEFLQKLTENADMYKRSYEVLEASKNDLTKLFMLQVLQTAVTTRWRIFPPEQKENIRNYIVQKIVDFSKSDALLKENRALLSRLNLVLVQILKEDWPHNWPSFIEDIVNSSKTDESLCENNMRILRLLSEEVFDFSLESMTAAKIKTMKESLNEEFARIFMLCQLVIENSQKTSLLTATLQTLQRFLTWIPLGYIFETGLLPNLLKFFTVPQFRTVTLDCLTEIASLPPGDIPENYRPTVVLLLVSTMKQLREMIPPDADLTHAYANGSDEECLFIQRLGLFLGTFLKSFLPYFDAFGPHMQEEETVQEALLFLTRISAIKSEDDDVFKTVLEFWQYFAKELYTTETAAGSGMMGSHGGMGMGGQRSGGGYSAVPLVPPLGVAGLPPGPPGAQGAPDISGPGGAGFRVQDRYKAILQHLRVLMIDHMAKPEEVIVVENDEGEIVRESTKDTEVIAQYKTMREAIVFITNLNYEVTECIMLEKLDAQVSNNQFTWGGLNTLCWAIGSVSGAMEESAEKKFLVIVIKDLLRLCEDQKGKDNKAVVATNIMYIVGQYPRFLRAHWKFLKTVVNKLFEFMHEKHPGVQDMACDTFLKIASKCKRKFMTRQGDDSQPFILTLIADLRMHIADLLPHQVFSFYESAGTMLSDHGPPISLERENVVLQLMHLQADKWKDILLRGAQNTAYLSEVDTARDLTFILRVNQRVCSSAGQIFIHQLSTIFLDMMNLYRFYSEQICAGVTAQGPIAVKLTNYKAMRQVKSEILELLNSFFSVCKDMDRNAQVTTMQTFLPPLSREVLVDYKTGPSAARDHRVLMLYATAVTTFKDALQSDIPPIMDHIFEPTLEMITANMSDFPEHRVMFFRYLQSANTHCFFGLFSIPAHHQRLVVDSIVWAVKHQERNISGTGLEILQELLQNISRNDQFSQPFYQSFLLSLVQDIMGVMTDRLHKSGFKLQAAILMNLFHMVQSGRCQVPLFDPAQHPGIEDNATFLKEHVGQLLLEAFKNLSQQQIINFVNGCFDVNVDLLAFKQHLRDFLINVKQFEQDVDNSELFSEEKQLQQERETEELQQYRKSVPGMLKPSELED